MLSTFSRIPSYYFQMKAEVMIESDHQINDEVAEGVELRGYRKSPNWIHVHAPFDDVTAAGNSRGELVSLKHHDGQTMPKQKKVRHRAWQIILMQERNRGTNVEEGKHSKLSIRLLSRWPACTASVIEQPVSSNKCWCYFVSQSHMWSNKCWC